MKIEQPQTYHHNHGFYISFSQWWIVGLLSFQIWWSWQRKTQVPHTRTKSLLSALQCTTTWLEMVNMSTSAYKHWPKISQKSTSSTRTQEQYKMFTKAKSKNLKLYLGTRAKFNIDIQSKYRKSTWLFKQQPKQHGDTTAFWPIRIQKQCPFV